MKVHIMLTVDSGNNYEGNVDLIRLKRDSSPSHKGKKRIIEQKTGSVIETKNVPEELVRLIASKADNLKIPVMVTLALKLYGNLTRSQQKAILENWGKKVGNNFKGGNYKRDIVDKGLAREAGQSNDETVYAITEKGKIVADEVFQELKSGSNERKPT